MQYFLYLLTIPFLYFNYKIIISDLKYRKIPNKYLGYLLLLIPFYYIYFFYSYPEIHYLIFLLQIFITFLISFILYFFGIWAAGDAKYLLVLSLFIPYIGITKFIGNIALITLFYLFGYFLWFYLYKIVFNKQYRTSLWGNIKNDLKEKWEIYKQNKGGNTYKIIFKGLLVFLLIFISIRLSRLYILNGIFKCGKNSQFILIREIVEKYNIYLIFLFIGLFVGGLILLKIGINKFKEIFVKKFKININLIGNILLGTLGVFLISFIIYEYIINPYEIKNYLIKILTIYISIYFVIKILLFSYKITFGITEINFININDLKEGDIVDKEYLIKMFGEQISLGYSITEEQKKKRKNFLLYPSPINYFSNINNPIDKETLEIIKNSYIITNKYHKENSNSNFKENNIIKILNTFSFAPYILIGFILTFLFQDKVLIYIINSGIEIFKYIINN